MIASNRIVFSYDKYSIVVVPEMEHTVNHPVSGMKSNHFRKYSEIER